MISTVTEQPAASAQGTQPRADKYGRALDYISASRLSCWQQCRRKHYFRYVANIPSEPSPAMHLGKVVHATLQQWNMWRWDKKSWTMDELHAHFFHQWEKEQIAHHVPWTSDKEHDTLRDKAWELVTAYLNAAIIDEGEDIAGVEVRLEAEIEGLPTIIGIVDLVREGGRIVDFKTAARSPSEDSIAHVHGTQLGIYALLYRHCTGAKELGIELHHLVKTKVPKVCISKSETVSDREINNLMELMHRYVDAVKAEDYTASPSFMCSGCEYLPQCKQWPDCRTDGKGDAP
jgi:putative RecB family exonuclease